MNAPSSAREALIAEALGEVARLLDRIDVLMSSMEANRLALSTASSQLDARIEVFGASTVSMAQKVQATVVDHIIKRTGKAASESIDAQSRAMEAAARVAFAAEVDSNLARLASSLRQVLHRVDRPLDVWLTHIATAVGSAALTWWVVSSLSLR